jgi:hypothetical protein
MAAYTAAYLTAGYFAKKEMDKPADIAKRAQKSALHEANVAKERAAKDAEDITQGIASAKRSRGQDVARNQTMVSDPLGISGRANVVRKTLTGQ